MSRTNKIAPDVQAELAALIAAIFDRSVGRAQLIELASKLTSGGQK